MAFRNKEKDYTRNHLIRDALIFIGFLQNKRGWFTVRAVMEEMGMAKKTAGRWLNTAAEIGLLDKRSEYDNEGRGAAKLYKRLF